MRENRLDARLDELVERYPDLVTCRLAIRDTFLALREVFHRGGKLLVCGNGGSAADSEHISGELMKGFLLSRPIPHGRQAKLAETYTDGAAVAGRLQGALPCISLASNAALISAITNDIGGDMVYAQQVYGYGNPGDALLGISTSGNAASVCQALKVARVSQLRTIGLSSGDGGAMAELCDVLIAVDQATTADTQERHLPIYHTLCALLEEEFFGPHESEMS